MSIYAIGDLHLGKGINKTMDIFGPKWIDHTNKIVENWKKTVSDDDTVIIPGDISWASSIQEAREDLDLILSLPGKKIMLMGNHDYWWQSLNKVSKAYPEIGFLQNNYILCGDIAVCGTRGWTCPNTNKFTKDDLKIYNREQIRLKLSLDSAVRAGYSNNILVSMHYPPVNDRHEASGFTEMFEQYGVKKVIYGHLHGGESFRFRYEGIHNGIEYMLVSADFIDFTPQKI